MSSLPKSEGASESSDSDAAARLCRFVDFTAASVEARFFAGFVSLGFVSVGFFALACFWLVFACGGEGSRSGSF